jgi:hypothetical protein
MLAMYNVITFGPTCKFQQAHTIFGENMVDDEPAVITSGGGADSGVQARVGMSIVAVV